MNFTEANSEFAKLILRLYRRIEENILGVSPKVLEQIFSRR